MVLTLHIHAGLPSSNARPDPVDQVGTGILVKSSSESVCPDHR